jgi:hypothetical protein
MDSKTDKNGVKVDIFVPDRDGFFVPLSTLCEHLEEKKQRLIRKKQITKQRLAILTRMVNNSRYEQVRFGVTLLLYLISLGCFFILVVRFKKQLLVLQQQRLLLAR